MTLIFWLQFAAVCIAGAMSPGPSLALIIRNSTKYNRLGGIMSAVGHGLGMGIYAIFAVTGLSIIILTNIYIFKSIQITGIIFLFVFVAIVAARAPCNVFDTWVRWERGQIGI